MDGQKSATIKRKLRVTFARKEKKTKIEGNVPAARARLKRKVAKLAVIEGARSRKDGSGSSGFKMERRNRKPRLVERK